MSTTLDKPTSLIQLRPYQETDIKNIEETWKENRSVLYQLPTGGGKSVVISRLIEDYQGEQILIFAHKRRLLTQLYERLNNIGINTGLLFAQRAENLDAPVLVVSIRTAVKDKRLETLLERKWDRVIIDEARHSRTGSYDKVLDALLEKYPMHRLLGVDATPFRKDSKRLDKHFQTMVLSSENTASLIEKGYLAKFRTYATPIGKIEETVKEAGGDYQSTELSNYMRQPKYLQYIIDTYKERGENRQAIVFAVDKAHAKDLKAKFEEAGYNKIAQIDSDMDQDEIDKAFADFESKAIQLLINIEMITEGVDLPDAGCIIGARPTKSLTLYLQIVGRGTRPKSDGSDLIVLDCCGWTEAYGVLDSPKHWSLNPDINPNNPREKNKVVGKRKDGTFTEDINDFVGELVEMTPAEYVQHLSGGLEQAEKVNVSIDDKISALFKTLVKLLTALLGKKFTECNFVVKGTGVERAVHFFHSSFTVEEYNDSYNTPGVIIMLDPNRYHLYARLTDNNNHRRGYMDDSKRLQSLHLSSIAGEFNKILLTFLEGDEKGNKIQAQIKGFLDQVNDLEKNKINLEAFKNQAKQFEREQWEKSVQDYLKDNDTLKLPNVLRADSFFRVECSFSGKLEAIIVPDKKINKTMNRVILLSTSGEREEKKSVPAEKIYKILVGSKWTNGK